jgi:hypothetical protein
VSPLDTGEFRRSEIGLPPADAPPVPHSWGGPLLILARDDIVEPNLVWSDTVLVRTGQTVDILRLVVNLGG